MDTASFLSLEIALSALDQKEIQAIVVGNEDLLRGVVSKKLKPTNSFQVWGEIQLGPSLRESCEEGSGLPDDEVFWILGNRLRFSARNLKW